MTIEINELDQMQAAYKTAVDQWIAAIREEEALASGSHSETEVDAFEAAGFREEDARTAAKEAKKKYEDAVREKFFNF
jgi:Holliday junction resolvasome RuvABC DNA-binding subunit